MRVGFEIEGKVRRTSFDTIEITADQGTLIKDIGEGISIEGPGLFQLEAKVTTKLITKFSSDAELSLTLKPTSTEHSITINKRLPLGIRLEKEDGRWSFKSENEAGTKLTLQHLVDEVATEFLR